jgi:hypothetical protein
MSGKQERHLRLCLRLGAKRAYYARISSNRRHAMGKLSEKYIVDEAGQKTAVVLPIYEYEELLEDLHDLAVIAERRDEKTISLDDLKKKLQADGIL